MKLMLNGQARDLQAGTTLSDLLTSLHLAENLVLVELNGHPIPRTDFLATTLDESDTVEIVRMVGGG
jgi:thiamine biosynthesis protein ThiS